ncbi:hypothetical protein [Streptomyces marispadix]|uniref:DUF8175 domain-containing protein n=1 Tax=Streptomyces marispadix TaxID=2922868 RepID=A0ABS9SXZ2_9ACTN|nr:hypothetical protein [Streptomyces marispadix]MCH6161152.1 hypothetical protein [Streptomyces marispadix]
MSIGGEGYGERDRTGDEGAAGGYGRGPAALTTTRTRLPDGEGGGGRPPVRPGRSLVTIVGVVVLLIAAIAFANQGGGGGGDDGAGGKEGGEAQPTAPTGQKPVKGGKGGIPSGFPKSRQGAESAAANYAVALGGDGMFSKATRHEIVKAVSAPSSLGKLQKGFDADYSEELNKKIGIDDDGKAPSGSTFVNRTMPVGTTVRSFDKDAATVAVWCSGLFGVAGEDSTKPVKNNWFTVTFKLEWTGGDWKVGDSTQKNGPTPVSGDSPISGAEEISKAVDEFGGFTYAR